MSNIKIFRVSQDKVMMSSSETWETIGLKKYTQKPTTWTLVNDDSFHKIHLSKTTVKLHLKLGLGRSGLAICSSTAGENVFWYCCTVLEVELSLDRPTGLCCCFYQLSLNWTLSRGSSSLPFIHSLCKHTLEPQPLSVPNLHFNQC